MKTPTTPPAAPAPQKKVLGPFDVVPGNWAYGENYSVLGVPGGCVVYHGNVGVYVPITQ